MRHLASGLRRHVPVPRQGTSTKTRSKLPAWRLTHLSRSPLNARRSTLVTPARRSRRAARSRRRCDTSQATSLPRLAIPAASAKVLPPAPAQKSTTRMPGRASASSAAICELSSCTSTRPCSKAASLPSGTRSRRRKPTGDRGVGFAATPSAASARRASSRSAFTRLTRRSIGAGPLRAAISRSSPWPKTRSR